MLNRNGGVIFFDCSRQYRQVLARGCMMTEKEKEAIEYKILSIL
jgi:hypothetical protein